MRTLAVAVLFILAVCLMTTAQAQAPDANTKLMKVSIRFDTPAKNDNKDRGTKVSVFVRNKVSVSLSQSIAELVDFAGDTEFKASSSHSFDLVMKSDKFVFKDIGAPAIQVRIDPNAKDRWVFSYTVTLTFEDGSVFSSSSIGNVILDQNNPVHESEFGGS